MHPKKSMYELAGKLQEPFTQSQNSPYWNKSNTQTNNQTQTQNLVNRGNMSNSGNQNSTASNNASSDEDEDEYVTKEATSGSQPVTAILPTGGMVITQGKQVLTMPGRTPAILPASQLPAPVTTPETVPGPVPSTPTPDISSNRKPEIVLPPLIPISDTPPKTEDAGTKKKGLSKNMIIIIAVIAVLLLMSSSAAAYYFMQKKPTQANNMTM